MGQKPVRIGAVKVGSGQGWLRRQLNPSRSSRSVHNFPRETKEDSDCADLRQRISGGAGLPGKYLGLYKSFIFDEFHDVACKCSER